MATNNSVNSPLSGTTGTGNFVGSTSPDLTTPKINQINDPNNNPMAYMYAVPSAVNYFQFVNQVAGQNPSIEAIGADANIQLRLAGKGTGTVNIFGTANGTPSMTVQSGPSAQHVTQFQFPATAAGQTVTFPDATGTVALSGASQAVSFGNISTPQLNDTNNNAILNLNPVASAVNYFRMYNNTTGQMPVLESTGSDANVSMHFQTKGTGFFEYYTLATSQQFQWVSGNGSSYTHRSIHNLPTTAATTNYTWPDASGTIQLEKSSPTIQTFTSGSGTYTTPAGVKYIVVEMCGGGGGGGCSGGSSGTAATNGGNTTFGTSLLTAYGGSAGFWADSTKNIPSSGSATISNPAYGLALTGGSASSSGSMGAVATGMAGGCGGANPFGGAGGGGYGTGTVGYVGTAGAANTGAGGGGAGCGSTNSAGGTGGGSGGYLKAVIPSPSSTYSYTVGVKGTGQGAGTNGAAGSDGAAGIIIVTEYYQ